MGPNNKRAQEQAAARNNVSARARFSKGPPKKTKGRGGGRGGRGGRNGGGGRGGRGGRDGRGRGGRGAPQQHQSVISKIAKKVEMKTSGGIAGVIPGKGGGSINTSARIGDGTTIRKRDALHGVDITKIDQVRLSEETVQHIMDLLTKLNVVEATATASVGATAAEEEKKSEEEEEALRNIRNELATGKSAGLSAHVKEFVPIFHHVDENGDYKRQDLDSDDEEEEGESSSEDEESETIPVDTGTSSAPNGLGLDNYKGGYEEYDDDGEGNEIFGGDSSLQENENENHDDLKSDQEENENETSNNFISSPLFLHLTTHLSFTTEVAKRTCAALEHWGVVAKPTKPISDSAENEEGKTQETTENDTNTKQEHSTLDSKQLALAMDWLCLHVSEDDLKKGFRPNPKQREVTKRNITMKGPDRAKNVNVKAVAHPSISFAKPMNEQEWYVQSDKELRSLGFLRLGFTADECEQACSLTGLYKNAIAPEEDDASLRILLSRLESKAVQESNPIGNVKSTMADLEFAREERKHELEAIMAIYGDEFQTSKPPQGSSNEDEVHYKLLLNDLTVLESGNEFSGIGQLHVLTKSTYPTISPPYLFFTNPTLPPTLLRRLNLSLARKAHELEGMPVVFEMMEFLSSEVPRLHDDFIKEQRTKEFEAEQRRIRESAGHDVDIVIEAQYEADEKIGRRQRAKLRAAEMAFDRTDKLEDEKLEKEKRRDERLKMARTATQNVRQTRTEKLLEQREKARTDGEAEKAARAAMNSAFLRGEPVEVARKFAERARNESLIANGVAVEEVKKEKGDTEMTLKSDKDDKDDSKEGSSENDDVQGNGTNVRSAINPRATQTTLAFTQRLKKFYEDAAKRKLEHGSDSPEVHLVKPESNEKDQPSDFNEGIDSHVPAPVFVPCRALNEVAEDVISQQKQQPWLLSPEARAPSDENDPSMIHTVENLSSEEKKKRHNISKVLSHELKSKYRKAEEWSQRSSGKQPIHSKKSRQNAPLPERFSTMLAQRSRLPAYKMKDKIIQTISNNQITVISGDTGCGKTTQVPQLVLDDWILKNKGAEANIIVTQPRRISAIGVAERIAAERCESVGQTVGYSIRLENRRSKNTRLLLCTTGILLRRLQVDPDLASVSHVFVDEVHERDLDTDFLLIILKDLLRRRKSLKLVLMSATMNADTFSNYFFGCPTASIPGRAHPVEEFRLEDVLQFTGHEIREGSDYALKNNKKTDANKKISKSSLKKLYSPKYKSHVISSLAIVDETVINYELISKLLQYITLNNDEGAILVFMSGFQEITKLIEELYKTEFFTDPSKVRVLPLHSSLSTSEQTAVFDVPPLGVRKIVISTNIAETSITIEDVVFVVDTGRVKENRQDEVAQVQTLVECWTSKASSKQRRGRAGRVRPGTAYHMYSTHTHDNEMRDYQLPEMLRVGLEDLVLQVLLLDLGEPSIFLTKAVNPPSALAIKNSLTMLAGLGAVECEWGETLVKQKEPTSMNNEEEASGCNTLQVASGLTALGFHLATLPVDPRVGKMMIYGALFGCTDPALTIAAAMSARSPFMSPFDKRDEADAARKKFALEGSDHLTTLSAFNKWRELRQCQGERGMHRFLRDNFLSGLTLRQMDDLRMQFSDLLKDIGFLPSTFKLETSRKRHSYNNNQSVHNNNQSAHDQANVNATNTQLIKALLCAGLYPNIIIAPRSIVAGGSGKGGKAVGEVAFATHSKGDAHLHPCTISFKEMALDSRYCCYHEIIKTSKLYVRDCSTVSEFALLLFGGQLTVHHTRNVITIDNWLHFRIGAKPATLVKYLRSQMEMLLLKKIVSPDVDVTGSAEGKALIEAISTLVQKEKNDVPDRSAADIVKPWNSSTNEGSRNNERGGRGGRGDRGGRSDRGGRGGRSGRGRGRGQSRGGRGYQRN